MLNSVLQAKTDKKYIQYTYITVLADNKEYRANIFET